MKILEKLPRRQDPHPPEDQAGIRGAQFGEVSQVAGDEVVSSAAEGGFQHQVVVGIVLQDVETSFGAHQSIRLGGGSHEGGKGVSLSGGDSEFGVGEHSEQFREQAGTGHQLEGATLGRFEAFDGRRSEVAAVPTQSRDQDVGI